MAYRAGESTDVEFFRLGRNDRTDARYAPSLGVFHPATYRLQCGTLALGRPLSSLEPRLDPKRFFRANRQQIINLEYIESVDLGVNGRLHVQLRGGPEAQVSRRQARLFRLLASI
jgi:hypothetical protein